MEVIIVTESGADLPEKVKNQYRIKVLPMHVYMDKNYPDNSFPITDIYEFYKRTKKIPKTSAVNPEDYREMFSRLHQEHPNALLLHLCYSAVTTATYQNALIGSEGMDYVLHMDTKQVSAGQAFLIKNAAQYLCDNPQLSYQEIKEYVEKLITDTRFAFLPSQLEYLKAGGRVSNAQYMGATLLNLKPLIELKDGYLVCTKKYRGSTGHVIWKVIDEWLERYHIGKEEIYLLYSEGFDMGYTDRITEYVKEKGYQNVTWLQTGGVITTHGGPGAFGIAGLAG